MGNTAAERRPQVDDLPAHPWSDDTIADLAGKYGCLGEGQGGDPIMVYDL
jgi:hypothetical protein